MRPQEARHKDHEMMKKKTLLERRRFNGKMIKTERKDATKKSDQIRLFGLKMCIMDFKGDVIFTYNSGGFPWGRRALGKKCFYKT